MIYVMSNYSIRNLINVVYYQLCVLAKLVRQLEEIYCHGYTVQEIEPYPDTQDTFQLIYKYQLKILAFLSNKIIREHNIISTTATVNTKIQNHKTEDNIELTPKNIHISGFYICITETVISRNPHTDKHIDTFNQMSFLP